VNRRLLVVATVAGLTLLATVLILYAGVHGSHRAIVDLRPTIPAEVPALTLVDSSSATPTAIETLPHLGDSELFANPDEPAYIPGKGFAPDAQRILDVASLQISLEKYHSATRQYPPTLASLFPKYAPVEGGNALLSEPLDPQTHHPYTYSISTNGASYRISAILSSGKQYSGVRREVR